MSSSSVRGKYTFLSWARMGIGTQIDNYEDNISGPRATVPITLNLVADSSNIPVIKEGNLYGPGDITGIMKDLVISTEPKPNESNFQPNYFPHIEFSQADFPWRFTPAKNKNSASPSKLTPWLCLIVLKQDEFNPAATSSGPLPTIKIINTSNSLPNLDQYWAWTHCQITDDITNLGQILTDQSHRATSRILSPRRLEANKKYFAFLVPSFKVGVLAGLGNVDAINNIKGTEFAWIPNEPQTNYELPVYYQWEFSTGQEGDFEALVRKL